MTVMKTNTVAGNIFRKIMRNFVKNRKIITV